MNKGLPDKPYHSIGKVKEAIKNNNFFICPNAQRTALDDFQWTSEDIERAILKLKPKDFSHRKQHFTNPELWIDHYRAYGLMGENVYTHVHFEDGMLIIGSFKTI